MIKAVALYERKHLVSFLKIKKEKLGEEACLLQMELIRIACSSGLRCYNFGVLERCICRPFLPAQTRHQSPFYLLLLLTLFKIQCSIYTEAHQPTYFDPEDGDSMYLQNVGNITLIHCVTTQEQNQHQ
jgi:hypothetical protein